jgi:hypothetical protein
MNKQKIIRIFNCCKSKNAFEDEQKTFLMKPDKISIKGSTAYIVSGHFNPNSIFARECYLIFISKNMLFPSPIETYKTIKTTTIIETTNLWI